MINITLTEKGLTYPDYPEILQDLIDANKAIYGQDLYLGTDSQDFQRISVEARLVYDVGCICAAIYNSFSPATAQGDALRRNVKINGIRALEASYSYADLTIVGTGGTVINNGVAGDGLGQKWLLPENVTIPADGSSVIARATAEKIGDIRAVKNTINKILTPTIGWQTVDNPADAVAGRPVESDAELRRRQALSVAIPSQTILEGIVGAVWNIAGVYEVKGIDNDGPDPDIHGIPGHHICIVVDGGDNQAIAETIFKKKTPSAGTYGDVHIIVKDKYGVPLTINFYRPSDIRIKAKLTIKKLIGYSTATGDKIIAALADAIDLNGIGQTVYLTKMIGAAYLPGELGNTYIVEELLMGREGEEKKAQDLPMEYRDNPVCLPADVELVVKD